MQIDPISCLNVDDALSLLQTVVPPRPSLRAALLAEGASGYLLVKDGHPALAVASTREGSGERASTLVRIASREARSTHRWLGALDGRTRALFHPPGPLECTFHAWETGALAHLLSVGLRDRGGRTIYMTSQQRHGLPHVDRAPVDDRTARACFEIDRAATRDDDARFSARTTSPPSDAEDAFADFERSLADFVARDDLFVFRVGGVAGAYLLLQENAIDTLVVHPDLQRRGLGSTLVRFACATLAARGHRTVSLLTSDTNVRAVRLYERHGFLLHSVNRWLVGAAPSPLSPADERKDQRS